MSRSKLAHAGPTRPLRPDMSVIEFLVGLALCRCGPSTSTAIAREVSGWLDCKASGSPSCKPSLTSMTARGWVRLDAGTYAIADSGDRGMCRAVYVGCHPPARRGQRFLDVGVFMSIVKDFERSL